MCSCRHPNVVPTSLLHRSRSSCVPRLLTQIHSALLASPSYESLHRRPSPPYIDALHARMILKGTGREAASSACHRLTKHGVHAAEGIPEPHGITSAVERDAANPECARQMSHA